MLSWVTSWWRKDPSAGTVLGPARNAPNDGHNIKAILEQNSAENAAIAANERHPTTVAQILVITTAEITDARRKLTPPKPREPSFRPEDMDVIKEMAQIFIEGSNGYFKHLRERREQARKAKDAEITERLARADSLKEASKDTKVELPELQTHLTLVVEEPMLVPKIDTKTVEQVVADAKLCHEIISPLTNCTESEVVEALKEFETV